MKQDFEFNKTRYRGAAKNLDYLSVPFASATYAASTLMTNDALDRAGHISAAAYRRFDLAVAVRARGDIHQGAVIESEGAVLKGRIAGTAIGVDGH